MKNIHLLPTDKPSRVFNTNEGEYHFREHYVPDTIQTCKNHNIYITSDEEIKEDDWFLDIISNTTHQAKQATGVFNTRKKIILTTDQDLIKDGVQPIDDEFLEWFVLNPSCEFVWTDYDLYSPLGRRMDPHTLEQNLCGGKWKYSISIPQEEPKQETMTNIHLLSTDKPSRLIIYSTLLNEFRLLDSPIEDWKHKQNIYITSDEEIKEGDWFKPLDGTNDIYKADKTWLAVINSSTSKKIILTTDQDLIKDGVQAIDDEFLEWFVKNPGCEKVEVIYSSLMKDYEYELLFPKETPQEEEQLPTKWFKTEQMETWIGESITTEGKEIEEIKGGRGKLIVMHQCGDNKEELISQLETMIYGLKEGFEYFVGN